MKKLEERACVYGALILLSLICGLFLGFSAGAWSFLQMALVIELTYLIGGLVRQVNYTAID